MEAGNNLICDKCKTVISKSGFEDYDFELSQMKGQWFPECSFGIKREIHLCQNCSDGLINLLEDEGYNINESEYSF